MKLKSINAIKTNIIHSFPAVPGVFLQVVIFQLLGNQCERHFLHPGQTMVYCTIYMHMYFFFLYK